MVRKLTLLAVFSVSALFFTTMICAGETGAWNGALPRVGPNDKLLIPLVGVKRQEFFYHPRFIIPENKIMSLRDEMDKKIAAECRAWRLLESSV